MSADHLSPERVAEMVSQSHRGVRPAWLEDHVRSIAADWHRLHMERRAFRDAYTRHHKPSCTCAYCEAAQQLLDQEAEEAHA